jgi:cell wall-associated NlpC family hydrolase
MDRSQVISEAQSWLGTPFHHQARLKGVGVDCVGLVIGVGKELGLIGQDFDITGYDRIPDGRTLMAGAVKHMVPIHQAEMQAGDVIVVKFQQYPQHFGFLGNYRHGGFSIIHAASAYGKVVEQRLMFTKAMGFVAAFKLPGVI